MADHLGIDALYVRLGFVALTLFYGFGLLMYALLWVVLRQEPADYGAGAPGLQAAARRDMRPPRRRRREDLGQIVATAVLAFGVILFGQALAGVSAQVFWPMIIGGLGLVLLWRQADEAQRARWSSPATVSRRWLLPLVGTGGWPTVLRAGSGLLLVVGALTYGVVVSGTVSNLGQALAAVLLALGGILLLVGPWLWRLTSDVSEERQERIRSQERADMAAHLHDSVLQTLALIQKQAHDQRAVQRLARSQERDLRQWLYGTNESSDQTVKAALQTAAADVEDGHGTPIEVVVVGDAPLRGGPAALVQAAREAMVNAAKHSEAPRIDVYAEIEDGNLEVFVRDRGRGFDPDSVGEDRLGVRRSILGRMERHGGTAEIRSSPGEGTEVRLRVAIESDDDPGDQPNGQNGPNRKEKQT